MSPDRMVTQAMIMMEFREFTLPLVLVVAYILAVVRSNRRYGRWPLYRTGCWLLGVCCAAWSVADSVYNHAHHSFTAHMVVHLLLGMLSPLLIALARPLTLTLRTLNRQAARALSRCLRSRLFSFISSPLTASALHVGGLWLLYATDLYAWMHAHPWLYRLVHVHLFAAGYLFTATILQLEASPHQRSLPYRMTVFMAASAVHAVLAKSLYAAPPSGVHAEEAALGSMVMFYGGDLAEILMLLVLFHSWYRSGNRRSSHYSPG